ncbi:hypothetical protein BaRGS_00022267 [Batillaria attramentaria]|uniref:Major facilitator superfamily (MFS) profile domain-containing protein n=1 Tax=Batillaria attramentaria TaxID=370345 RepID=A0ABD0KHC7_9CAEN
MVVVGCFGMHVLVVGGVKSFGVLFVELQHMYGVSAQQLGVVHGLASVLMMALGPVSNALSVRYTCRSVVFAGGLLIGTGFVSSAFVPSFQWLYFTYSSLTGLGAALAYAPSVVMVGHHFTKRRALANGISVSGSAVGSFVLPNLMRHLLNSYGLKGALAIIGAMMFHVCACAVLFRPLSSYKFQRKTTKAPSLEEVQDGSDTDSVKSTLNSDGTRSVGDRSPDIFKRNRSLKLKGSGSFQKVQSLKRQMPTDREVFTPLQNSFTDENLVRNGSVRSATHSLSGNLQRNESFSSTKVHVGSFKQRFPTMRSVERSDSFKTAFAGRGISNSATSSFKRRAYVRGTGSLERHPSALWDARLPGSFKGHPRRGAENGQVPRVESLEMTSFNNSFDSFQDQENSDVGGASVKTGNKAEQKNPKRIGSFKAVDIVNPIKFIHERKKLLLANNLRYMSETGGVPAGERDTPWPDEKAPLKRFYSVEQGTRSGGTALHEPYLHRRIRQISEADSWRSESSVFASAGDLALASLQNISESAAETENDDVFSTTSKGSSAKGFLRLSAKRVSKGETKSTSVPLFDWSLLVNPVFLVFFCSLICMNFGYPNVFVMLPSYCQEVGLDKTGGAFMVSVIGLGDLVGRIFIGWFSDLRLFPRKYGFMASMAAAGLLCALLPQMKTTQGLIAFCCCFGFFGGCFIALIAVILVDSLGKERLATSFGLASVAMAVGIFAGPAIYGGIHDTSGSWDVAFFISGLMSLLAASCILLEPLAQHSMNIHSQADRLQDELL